MEKGLFYVVILAFIKMGLGKMFLATNNKRLSVVTGQNREWRSIEEKGEELHTDRWGSLCC